MNIKGRKADYIFRIYLNEKHQEELTSICLDMKSENPDFAKKIKRKMRIIMQH